MEEGRKSMADILSAPQRCKEDKSFSGRLSGARISSHQVVSGRSTVYIQSTSWSCILVKVIQSGGIGYILLDPMEERWSQIASTVKIDSGTRTCTTDKPKAPSGMSHSVIDRMVEDQSESNQRLLWFPESELVRWIILKCPAEFGMWHMIRRWKVKGISHQWLRMILGIKAARRLKWRSPAEFVTCHPIQRLMIKGDIIDGGRSFRDGDRHVVYHQGAWRNRVRGTRSKGQKLKRNQI